MRYHISKFDDVALNLSRERGERCFIQMKIYRCPIFPKLGNCCTLTLEAKVSFYLSVSPIACIMD
jgi:hypothetical protein